ncbi:MAG TPA: hypothetical protein PK609_01960 [Candidatus Paceibacterota bacterium]|nr:hypothetical protein [Candidatus Paceibacterota bacterium]
MIITLPITVRETAPLGYWLTPVLTDALGKQLQEEVRIYTGGLGLRSPNDLLSRKYFEDLDFLSVTRIRESDAAYAETLLEEASRALLDRPPEYIEQLCYVCPCGKLQLPVAIATYAREKTFRRGQDGYFCKACGEDAFLDSVKTGFFSLDLSLSLESIGIFPQTYRAEAAELLRQIKEQGIPAVRERVTGLPFKDLSLDVEFVWQFLPFVLSKAHVEERIRILVTNHVLRQAVTAIAIAKLLNPSLKADIVVAPCIIHPGSPDKWNIERLKGLGYTGPLLRAMLIGSLGWKNKDVPLFDSLSSVELRRFGLLEELVLDAPSERAASAVLDTLSNLSQQNLVKGLKNVFNPEKFSYQSLTGLF